MTSLNNNYKAPSPLIQLFPLMFCFFAMGFVDLVGVASNYVQRDLNLSESDASLFPSMVFFWFLIFSVPTGVLMSKIGRKKTVIISLIVTGLSLVVPFINYSYYSMLIAFSLLGIGNTIMQVSLNPLLSCVVSGDRLASSLTFGQFVKALASFAAPILMAQAVVYFSDWKIIMFPLFTVISVIAIFWLGLTSINESDGVEQTKTASFKECFSLLILPIIFFCFLGIMCHVGIDVGINTVAPKIFRERLGMELEAASYATVVYFIFRTIGCFSGSFILAIFSPRKFFTLSVILMILSMIGFAFFHIKELLYVSVALVGFGNSNIFPIIFSQALLRMPDKKNEISGLMIMGIFGGAVFSYLIGITTTALQSQMGAVLIISLCVAYLIFMSFKIKDKI